MPCKTAARCTVLHRPEQGSVADWLLRARSSLEIAKWPYGGARVVPEDLCFQAQQAAEKALKAVYIHRQVTFRFTHDIRELIVGLRHQGINVPGGLDDSTRLTKYAVESRYPYFAEIISEEDRWEAVRLAESVLDWAEAEISGPVK